MCFTYADLCVGSGGESQESGPSHLGEVLLLVKVASQGVATEYESKPA